jgi:adenylate cyclase
MQLSYRVKKKLQKLFIYFIAVMFIFIAISSVNIYFSSYIETFDNKIRDSLFLIRGPKPHNDDVLIVDIDEKSLDQFGQWPWPRNVVGKIFENLALSNVGVIGLDVVFAEVDQSSPAKVLKDYNITGIELPDYDEYFNYIVQNTPTILGYQFELNEKPYLKQEELNIPGMIIERNRNIEGEERLINAVGTVLNNPALQNSAYSSGFFNNIPDSSGVIRSVPLVIRYDGQLYPSLALEVVRVAMGIKKVYVNYSDLGVESVQIGDFFIPTDRHGRFIVNFRGPGHSFKYYSALDIYNENFDPKEFEGKFVLLGTTAAGLNDMRAMPFESVYPGVEVHANIIDNIINGDFLYIPNWIDGANVLIILVLVLLTVIGVKLTPIWLNPFIVILLLASVFGGAYYVFFEKGIVLNILLPMLSVILSAVVIIFIDYILEIKKEQAIRSKFASKVSKEVMENLIHTEGDTFTAMEKEVTVFFSDVRNFTNISEAMPNAKTLIEFLNEYMDPMTEIVIEEKGTVDKFIGDAVMAYWNAPGDVPDHANAAVIATMKQLYKVIELNDQIYQDQRFTELLKMCEEKKIPPLDIGIGLNTGEVIVGEMGSKRRSDYTIIGDPVNLGARLESLCKYYGSKCNISTFTKELLPENTYIFRFLDYVTVKGQSKPVEIWQVVDFVDGFNGKRLLDVSIEKLNEELQMHHHAIELYKGEKFSGALEIFKKLNNDPEKTNKNIYAIYIDRCEHYIDSPPENFDGVFIHTTKG